MAAPVNDLRSSAWFGAASCSGSVSWIWAAPVSPPTAVDMERLVSGPLKALGWIIVTITVVAWFGDVGIGPTLIGLATGAGAIWAGRWVTSVRHARLERYDEAHQRRVDRLRGRAQGHD